MKQQQNLTRCCTGAASVMAWEAARGKISFCFCAVSPFLEVSPSYYNTAPRCHQLRFHAALRYPEEAGIRGRLSGPMQHAAKLRWELSVDLRNENWAIRNGFSGPAPVLASFNMRSAVGRADVASYSSARLGWSIGGELFRTATFAALCPEDNFDASDTRQRL